MSLSNNFINVFVDGSCINNGKKNPIGGIGIYFGENDPRNLSLKYEYDNCPTNNKAELYAIYETILILLDEIKKDRTVLIYSDSQYCINSITKWYKNWEKNGWLNRKKKAVKNKNILLNILKYTKIYPNIRFKYVKAHCADNSIESINNNLADKLAKLRLTSKKNNIN